MSRRCDHDVAPGRTPGTERCRKCSWRFPCRDNDCAHSDCLEFRQELPRCHYCRVRVEGPPAGFCSPNSTYEIMRVSNDNSTWTRWGIGGITRACHYACRSSRATQIERVRWGEVP